jgi:hypothetical protein
MARIQIIKDERDCNRCGRKGCGGDVIRDGKGGIRSHLVCPGHTGVQPFRMPLLTLAAQNRGSLTALAPVLEQLGLQLDIIPRRPGFRFIVKNTDQEVR